MVDFSVRESLKELWQFVGDLVETKSEITLRWWSEINEYLYENIGKLLYFDRQFVDFGTNFNESCSLC